MANVEEDRRQALQHAPRGIEVGVAAKLHGHFFKCGGNDFCKFKITSKLFRMGVCQFTESMQEESQRAMHHAAYPTAGRCHQEMPHLPHLVCV